VVRRKATKINDLIKGARLIEERVVSLTKEFCEELGKLEHVEWERPLNERHVDRIVHLMKSGHFHPEWVIVMIGIIGKRRMLCNAKHTMYARAHHMPDTYNPPVRVLTYEADDEEQLRETYSQIDQHASRTVGQQSDAFLYKSAYFPEASKVAVRLLVKGFRWSQCDSKTRRSKFSVTKVVNILIADPLLTTANMVLLCMGAGTNKHLYKAPVVGAMFTLLCKSPKESALFWDAVRDGAGLQADDPRLKLRTHLLAMSGKRGVSSDEQMEKTYRVCIHAWNAFRRGERQKTFTVPLNCDRPTAEK